MMGIALLLLLQGPAPVWAQRRDSRWTGATGAWQEAANWEGGLPSGKSRAMLGGHGETSLKLGRQVVGGLLVGTGRNDDTELRIDGGELIVRRNFVQIGEMGAGSGTVVLESGALHCVGPVYLGGANAAPDRNCRGLLRITGGSFAARMLTMGWGEGAEATLEIRGSRAESICLLDYLTTGTYLNGEPSRCRLVFTLDAQGVTPIVIAGAKYGLTILQGKTNPSCRLEIALSSVPPRDDVTLVSARAKTKGVFDGLPEGAEIAAGFGGRTYRWTLTYQGGKSGCDLALLRPRGFASDDAVTQAKRVPDTPRLLWTEVPLGEPIPKAVEPAFAGAEGFGAIAQGGRGGPTLIVSNLDDAGPGSLRAAMATKGPRTVEFQVGGVIDLKSPLQLREPFVSILGQTAPGMGITLRGHGLMIQTHDVVLRHLRIRPGDEANDEDAIEFHDAERCIADHCSFGFGSDETCSIVGLSDAITIQHCIISEGLNRKGHSMAAIAGGERTTWHHNLIAHCRTRNVRFADVANCDFRNNVIYNWGDTACYGQFERVNLVANYFKPGPSTQKPAWFHTGESVVAPGTLFIRGNIMLGWKEMTQDNWLGVAYEQDIQSQTEFAAPEMPMETAESAFKRVLAEAGATLPQRDTIDMRVVMDARLGTGRIVNTVAEAGGWPEYTPTVGPKKVKN